MQYISKKKQTANKKYKKNYNETSLCDLKNILKVSRMFFCFLIHDVVAQISFLECTVVIGWGNILETIML